MEVLAKTKPVKMLEHSEENALIRQSLNGDRRAQFRLYQQYVRAMYHTIIRMVANPQDAEDLTQELFVKVFKNLDSFKGESTLGAWIKRIAVNTTLNFLRSKGNMRFVETTENLNLVSFPENESETQDLDVKKIHGAIKKLPEGCRVVFNLYLMEGYRHKEIATILEISESTSKTQYRRAKKLIRENLERTKF